MKFIKTLSIILLSLIMIMPITACTDEDISRLLGMTESMLTETTESTDTTESTQEAQIYKATETATEIATETVTKTATETATEKQLSFRSKKLLNQHYEKHGIEMGFSSAEEYEKSASEVVKNPNALHKTEAEDGDDVYYVEETNEFVIVSTDGYLRTYFYPSSGINYYNRQ